MDELNGDDFSLFPEWKQAVRDFVASGFVPGSTIPHEWFLERFGMADPVGNRMTAEEYQERQFKWLRNMTSLREALLEQHQIALDSVAGIGYRVILPHEQSEIAMRRMRKEMRSALTRAVDTVTHTRTAELTDDQRRERNDALAKLAMLKGLNRAALKGSDE